MVESVYEDSLKGNADDMTWTTSDVEIQSYEDDEETQPVLTDLEWNSDDIYPPAYIKQLKEWSDKDPGPSAGQQQIAIASYINPKGDPGAWDRLLSYDVGKVSVLVANILNGPDYIADDSWKAVIDRAASRGTKIIGYVRTGYLGVSSQKFTTRLGSSDLADWVSQIEQDVDKWFELYGTNLGGIFFDEGWPECGPDNIYANVYAHINSYTKRKYPGSFTVLNPGSPIAQCFEETMDSLLTFESSYETYQNSYVPNNWIPRDPRKIWHIIYRVPENQVANVAALALARHAGLVQITDDDNPNPYDNLPGPSYMSAALAAVSGGKPNVASPSAFNGAYTAGLPGDSSVTFSDYSSVKLQWSAVPGALGYAVYMNGALKLELPPSLTKATVGGIHSGTKGISFEVRTRLDSGGGGSSRIITASTLDLPSKKVLRKPRIKQNGDGSYTYSVDVMIPFAFVRLFFTDGRCYTTLHNGWPVRLAKEDSGWREDVIGVFDYMMEGNDFYTGIYKYTGDWYRYSDGNAPWSWQTIGVAKQSIEGYTYSWTFKIDGFSTSWTSMVQSQGYAPMENIAPKQDDPTP